ncbi:MAG: DUF6077 domain-containing protein [Planctomycetota bacterium]|jgi:hypothetical protein
MATHEAPALPSVLARLVLVWWAVSFGLLTVLTHAAQAVGMSFTAYVIVGVAVTVAATAVLLRAELPRLKAARAAPSRGVTFGLLACCLLSLALCVVSYRPATDDVYYIPNVVYCLENPAEAMGFTFHYIETGGPLISSYHRGSIPFEYVQAMAAHVTPVDLLTVYYVLAPAFFGVLLPLAWFYLLTRFVRSSSAAVFGTLTICLSLLLMGAQERSWGHYAFDRIFEGKTVMLAICMPFFVALTMDFFRAPRARTWLVLLALSTAMIGCTVASAALVPLLALVLTIAAVSAFVRGTRARLQRSLLYLSSLVYPGLYAVSIILLSLHQIGSDTALNRTWPVTFAEHAAWVLDDPGTIVFLIVGTVGSLLLFTGCDRRFLIVWFMATAVLYVNPVVAPFMIHNVTSPNMYWRLFYLLPFPLVIGLAGAGLHLRFATRSAPRRLLVTAGVPSLLLLAHVPEGVPTVFRADPAGGVPAAELRLPGPRVADLSLTRQVLEAAAPEGTMLAPQSISTVTAMLTARYRHICYRADGMRAWFEGTGRKAEATRRMKASRFLDGQPTIKGLSSVQWLVQHYPQVNTVVARQAAVDADDGSLGEWLREQGFVAAGRAQDLAVFSRPGSGS